MGGKLSELSDEENKTCLDNTLRSCRYFCILEAYWKPSAGDAGRDAARAWVRKCAEILRPHRTAVLKYAPDAITDEFKGAEALTDIAAHDLGLSANLIEKLGRLKGKYDPKNFFCQNANIKPIIS
jgi:hypothetical protein